MCACLEKYFITMSYHFHKNGVITGYINSFCLACDCFLNSEQEACEHVGTSSHGKRLSAIQYSDKFKGERIRKFIGGYFCEFCNVLLPIATKVTIHVTEEEHKHKKGIHLLKPIGHDVVAFNNILIEEKAWHGLMEDVCSICSVEFDDEDHHKSESSHSLNLVLKPIKFGGDNAIYRHIDDSAIQCLTCNKLIATNMISKHFKDIEHHELYAKRRIENSEIGSPAADSDQKIMKSSIDNQIETPPVISDQKIMKSSTDNQIETTPVDSDQKIMKSLIDNQIETPAVDSYQKIMKSSIDNQIETPAVDSAQKIMKSSIDNQIETPAVDSAQKIMKSPIDNDCKNNKQSSKKSAVEQNSQILEYIVKYQSKGININLKTETVSCKKCFEVIKFELIEIENHIENHSTTKQVDPELLYPSYVDQNLNRVNINDSSINISNDLKGSDLANENIKMLPTIPCSQDKKNKKDTDTRSAPREKRNSKCDRAEAGNFAKENHLTYNEVNDNAYCRICDVKLPSPIRSMKEHVEGATHRKLAGPAKIKLVKPTEPSISKQEARRFIDTVIFVENLFCYDAVVNEEYCMPRFSFWLISKNTCRLRCILCEVNLPPHCDVRQHVSTRHHTMKMELTSVITSERSEFIREIRPGLYHCGYCNLVVSCWDEMKQHLKCSDHREKKANCERSLQDHLPDISRWKMQKEMEAMAEVIRLFRWFN